MYVIIKITKMQSGQVALNKEGEPFTDIIIIQARFFFWQGLFFWLLLTKPTLLGALV